MFVYNSIHVSMMYANENLMAVLLVNVEKLHDLGGYGMKYRQTMRLNILKSPKSGISLATGHNQLASVQFTVITLVNEPRIWHNELKNFQGNT